MKLFKIRVENRYYDVTIEEKCENKEFNEYIEGDVENYTKENKSGKKTFAFWINLTIALALLIGAFVNFYFYWHLDNYSYSKEEFGNFSTAIYVYAAVSAILITFSVVNIIFAFMKKNMTIKKLLATWSCLFASFLILVSSMNIIDDYNQIVFEFDYYLELESKGILKSQNGDYSKLPLYKSSDTHINNGRKYRYYELSVTQSNSTDELGRFDVNKYFNHMSKLINDVTVKYDRSVIYYAKEIPNTNIGMYFSALAEDFLYTTMVIVTVGMGQVQPQDVFAMVMTSFYLLFSQVLIVFGIAIVFSKIK